MHCTQPGFADMMILPLYNDLHAVVVQRRIGDDPRIITSGVAISYSIPSNTYSVGAIKKTDFWDYTVPLLARCPRQCRPEAKSSPTTSPGDNNDWVVTACPSPPST
jgi:hypothetical protein